MRPPHTTNCSSSTGVLDARNLVLDPGILLEPIPDSQRVILWLPGKRNSGFQDWERVSTVPYTEFTVQRGIHAAAAASVPVRQPLGGLFGKLWRRFRATAADQSWFLPNGELAEQAGQRQTDLILVWAEEDTIPLDEEWIQLRWPGSKRRQQIGEKLFLVSGIEPPGEGDVAEQARSQGCPRQLAEQQLATARQRNDRRQEASALIDLGVISLHEGDVQRAVAQLEEARAIVGPLGDRSQEGDILGNLALAALMVGQPRRALELIEQELAYARESGDRFAEKVALERLGLAYAKSNDPRQALAVFEQALALAREVGHRKHEADLLWLVGIQQAELGWRDQAVASAQAAVDLLEELRNPQAGWYAEHLRRYRACETGEGLGGTEERGVTSSSGEFLDGSIASSVWTMAGPQAASQAVNGPGLLRMALSAAKSMAKFLGSGLRTAPAPALQRRLRTCAACEHHTGLRCKLCGCFTNVKARMAHEECPLGKWPA